MSDNGRMDETQAQVFLPGEDWSEADLARPVWIVGEAASDPSEPTAAPHWAGWEDAGYLTEG